MPSTELVGLLSPQSRMSSVSSDENLVLFFFFSSDGHEDGGDLVGAFIWYFGCWQISQTTFRVPCVSHGNFWLRTKK